MPRPREPFGLRLTEQDVLDQLPALGAWSAPARPQPMPLPTTVTITTVRGDQRP